MNPLKMRFSLVIALLTIFIGLTSCSNDDDIMAEQDDNENAIEIMKTSNGVEFVRTPSEQFENLPDWPYEYKYIEINGLRQAYTEAGPLDGPIVLLLHGQPAWSYLYRKMIPILAEEGYRVIAMDHLGFGRSDKPIDIDDYTYLDHTGRLEQFIIQMGLQDINLFVQDWGSLIGLKVAGENTDWFATIAVGNGQLKQFPVGDVYPPVQNPNEVVELSSVFDDIPPRQPSFYNECQLLFELDEDFFPNWMEYAMKSSTYHASEVIEFYTWFPVPEEVEAAYDAPFPSREYMAGTRKMPSLINEIGGNTDDAAIGLSQFQRPFLTIWADNDPSELGWCETQQYFIDNVPGAKGKPHARLNNASHFLQDDQGVEIARRLVAFYKGDYEGGNFPY